MNIPIELEYPACKYSDICSAVNIKDEIIDFLLDELEAEHCGARAWAANKIKEIWNIDV